MNKDQYFTILEMIMDMTVLFREEIDNQNKRIDELMEYIVRREETYQKDALKQADLYEKTKRKMKRLMSEADSSLSYDKMIADVTRNGLEFGYDTMYYSVYNKQTGEINKFVFKRLLDTYKPIEIIKTNG